MVKMDSSETRVSQGFGDKLEMHPVAIFFILNRTKLYQKHGTAASEICTSSLNASSLASIFTCFDFIKGPSLSPNLSYLPLVSLSTFDWDIN